MQAERGAGRSTKSHHLQKYRCSAPTHINYNLPHLSSCSSILNPDHAPICCPAMSLSTLPHPLNHSSYPTTSITTSTHHDPYVLSAGPTLIPPMSSMMSPYSPPSDTPSLPPLPAVPVQQSSGQRHQRGVSNGKKRAAANADNNTHHRKRSSFNPRSNTVDASLPSTSTTLTAQQRTKDMLLSSLATSAQEKGTKFRSRTLADLQLHEMYLQQCQMAVSLGIPVPPPPQYGLGPVQSQYQLLAQQPPTPAITLPSPAKVATNNRRSRRRSQTSYTSDTADNGTGEQSLDRQSLHICTHVDPLTQHHCNKSFTKPSSLQRHQKLHQRDAALQQQHLPTAFVCDQLYCGLSFDDRAAYMRHLRVHSRDVKPFGCQFPTCIQSFDEQSELYSHMQQQHPNPLNDMLQMLHQPDSMDDDAWQRWIDAVREMHSSGSERQIVKQQGKYAMEAPSSDYASLFTTCKSPVTAYPMTNHQLPRKAYPTEVRSPSFDLPEPSMLAASADEWIAPRRVNSPPLSLKETTAALGTLSIDDFLQLPSPSYNNVNVVVKQSIRRLAYTPSDDNIQPGARAGSSGVLKHSSHARTMSQDVPAPHAAARPPLIPINHKRMPPSVHLPVSQQQSSTYSTKLYLGTPRLSHDSHTSLMNNTELTFSNVVRHRRDSMNDSPSALSKLLHLPRNSLLLPGYSPLQSSARAASASPADHGMLLRTPSLTPLPLLQPVSVSPLQMIAAPSSPAIWSAQLSWPMKVDV